MSFKDKINEYIYDYLKDYNLELLSVDEGSFSYSFKYNDRIFECTCSKGRVRNTVPQKLKDYLKYLELIDKANLKYSNRFIYPSYDDYPGGIHKTKIIDSNTGYEFYQEMVYHVKNLPADFPKEDKSSELISKVDPKYKYISGSPQKLSDLVTFECPKHGQEEKPIRSWIERGCFKCSYDRRTDSYALTYDQFISKAREKFGDKYEYDIDPEEFKGTQCKIRYKCPIHGWHDSQPVTHLNSETGCFHCGAELKGNRKSYSLDDFITLAKAKFGDMYSYDKVDYKHSKSHVLIKCNKHNEYFWQIPNSHLIGKYGCPKCVTQGVSKKEQEIKDYILSLGIIDEYILMNTRPRFMNGKEIDLFLPDFKFGIEYNGISFHHSNDSEFTDEFYLRFTKDKNYHHDKWKLCQEAGINLLSIPDFYWEDLNKQEIIKSKIRHYLKMDRRIYARKCSIVEIENSFANDFYNRTHIEGSGFSYKNSKSFGLSYEGSIVMCITIGEIYNQSSKSWDFKVSRISTELDITVVGGLSKLIKHLKDIYGTFKYQYTTLFGGSTFNNFESRYIGPRYFWVNPETLEYYHRNHCQKSLLEKNFKEPLLEEDTESSYMSRLGYLRYYDSGIYEIKI